MTATLHRESAKIYTFPIPARATVGVNLEAAKQAELLAAQQVPHAGYGDSWYHEAAIQEAGRALKS